jgi:hypothetical protein
MTKVFRSPAPISVSAADGTVVAGQSLEVTVRFVADRPSEIAGGEVELTRTTAFTHFQRQWMGAASRVSVRSSTVLGRADLDIAGPLTAGQHLVRRVTLTVPPEEATIAGQLVQQDYLVRARIRTSEGRDGEGFSPLRIGSAAGREWAAGAAPTVDDAGFAGIVTVTPRRPGTARSVRVELVLDEHVPARADEPLEEDRHAATVVATVPVAERVDLEARQPQRFPFTLRVPLPLPAPSTSTPGFTVRWLLRAVLDWPLRSDPATTVELSGTTA